MSAVRLHVYDLSNGMARQLSQAFLGKQIDGIWHTGIVVYGREYFFGGGIQMGPPGQTPYGSPVEEIELGTTAVPQETFHEFLRGISSRYTVKTYNLLSNNCNNFSNEASQFLVGRPIPSHITGLPSEVLATPFGSMLAPLVQNMQQQMSEMGDDDMSEFQSPFDVGAAGASGSGAAGGAPGTAGGGAGSMHHLGGHSHPERHWHDDLALSVVTYRESVLFAQAKPDSIAAKLQQFIAEEKVTFGGEQQALLASLVAVLTAPSPTSVIPPGALPMLMQLLTVLPPAKMFPALDLVRLMVLHPACNRQATALTVRPNLLDLLQQAGAQSTMPAPYIIMVLRIFANLFAFPDGAAYVMRSAGTVVDCACAALSKISAARMSAATLLYNVAVAGGAGDDDVSTSAVACLCHALSEATAEDAEMVFRMLMALGQYLLRNDTACGLARSLGLPLERLTAAPAGGATGMPSKVRDAANEIKHMIAGQD